VTAPRVRVDFARRAGRGVSLDGAETRTDLVVHRIQLRDGLALTVYEPDEDDDGEPRDRVAEGVVYFDVDHGWVLELSAGPGPEPLR
jgi:hypothetical protein